MKMFFEDIHDVAKQMEEKMFELDLIDEALSEDEIREIEEALQPYCQHDVVIATYGDVNVAIESLTTNEVIIDSDLLFA